MTFQTQWRFVAVLSIVQSIFFSVLSLGYFSDASTITTVWGFFSALSFYYVLTILIYGVLFCLLVFFKLDIFKRLYGFLFGITLIVLVADIIVFSQYRLHINATMVDLFFHAGDTISFSFTMWCEIIGLAAVLLGVATILTVLSVHISQKKIPLKRASLLLTVLFLCTQVGYMICFASYKTDIIITKNYIPLYQPLHANRLLSKLGIKSNETRINVSTEKKLLNYPLSELTFSPTNKHHNVVFLLADSLRGDMVTPEIMPNTYQWAQENIIFSNHFSASTGTRAGIFGLFYGLAPMFWGPALETRTTPILIDVMQSAGFTVQAYATASLKSPEFADTVFARVRPLRISSKAKGVGNADQESVNDFKKFLAQRKQSSEKKPFFSFIFLDSPHGYAHPKKFTKFLPEALHPNYLTLNNSTNPEPLKNLYKNSVHWIDHLFGEVIDALKAHKLLDDTIVVITSDHGQEINDSKKNFWGHGSAYTYAQTHIPLIVHWPGMSKQVVKDRTICYDVPATLLLHEFKMTSPVFATGFGDDLFGHSLKNRTHLVLSGAYTDDIAILENDRTIVIDRLGLLNFYDSQYNSHPKKDRTPSIYKTFKMISSFLK